MKDIDCCKDCKKRGTDCHGDVFYYNSSPICREFISDEPSVWEENTMLEEELAVLKEKYRWHDSRVEKIPQSVSILHCPVYEIRAVLPSGSSHLFEAVMIAEDLICEAKNFDYYYWRLLDELPKKDVRP